MITNKIIIPIAIIIIIIIIIIKYNGIINLY